jgi:caa(3)-type oxidase subunit IV
MSNNDHEDINNHEASYGQLVIVFFILLALTAMSIAVASLDVSETFNVVALMGLASLKVGIIAIHWMHLKHEEPIFWILVLIAVLTLGVFFVFTFFDYFFRETLFVF